ncbi:MAG: KpsF/GutQ family sugar-phosphate isomerase [Ignavibacteriaceae bacterium]|nr:KpsF/GutQ family sugar-phosphate isomerase [Ignavibacteriaceae bacterium]
MSKLDRNEIISYGKQAVKIEADAVRNLYDRIDDSFVNTINLIFNCKGRVVITGVGKSGLIARKVVATMNSTGTAAIFLHPTDALHGDLGMVRKEDVVIILSKSGASEELLMLIPMLKRLNIPLIGFLGDKTSKIAKQMDIIINIHVDAEACPYDLAPTASTTAQLAMGDALAVTLLKMRGFSEEDFANLHPGGSLGKRLSLKVSEIMVTGVDIPIVNENSPIQDAIFEITSKRLGAACVVNEDNKLTGLITDGDLRRLLEKTLNISGMVAKDFMTQKPKTLDPGHLASYALQKMENYKITSLPIVNEKNEPAGFIHIHDLINLGLKIR